jgi:hypothetical protein
MSEIGFLIRFGFLFFKLTPQKNEGYLGSPTLFYLAS